MMHGLANFKHHNFLQIFYGTIQPFDGLSYNLAQIKFVLERLTSDPKR